jgi:hypothetical protein
VIARDGFAKLLLQGPGCSRMGGDIAPESAVFPTATSTAKTA